jgi:hypothetical protein
MVSDSINGSGMRTRLASSDWSAAALVAGAVVLVLTLWPYPIPHPCMWDGLAVAAGMQPPASEFPGLGNFVLRIVLDVFGPGACFGANMVCAHLLAGATAALWCFVFRQLLEFCGRLDMADHLWNRKICPAIAAAGALLVAFSEPVWTSSQSLSAAGVDMFLAAFAFTALLRFIARGRRPTGLLAFLSFGFLAGDTPFGVLLLVPVGVLLFLSWRMIDARDDIEPGVRLPPIEEFPWTLMTLAWVVGLGITVAIADSCFRAGGGDPGDFSRMFDAWLGLLREGSTFKGALYGAAVTVLPLLFMVAVHPRLTFPDAHRPYLLRIACLIAGLVAASQFVDVPELRYRNWVDEDEAIATTLLPGLYMAAAGAAVTLSASAFAAMVWCHETRFGMFFVRVGRLAVIAAVVAIVCNSVFSRQCREVRAKLDKVNTHLTNTLKEAENSDVIQSHGRLDVMLRLKARAMGRKVTIVKDGE